MIGWLLLGVALVALAGTSWQAARARRAAAIEVAERLDAAIFRLVGDRIRNREDPAAGWAQFDRAVDEREALGREAHEVRQRLAAALDAIVAGVVVVDAAGHVVFHNKGAAALDDARHGDAIVRGAVGELLDEGVRGTAAKRTVDLYGPPRRTFVVSTTPLRVEDELIGAVAVVDDVTEHRRIDAVRRDFVANISHELKTPIGAISLLAETLLMEDDPAICNRLTSRMVDEADRVNRTIEDLLVLSRIEHEEAPAREPVPVHLVVAEAVDRIRPAAELDGVSVVVREPDPRLVVRGDRRQIVSALYNLLDNAVKYSDPGTEVGIRAWTDGKVVDIEVSDHGIGIPAKDIERVFERFYRVDQGRSRQTGGTGLGLAIVRHVAANHDGDVRVESRLGEGSRFTLALPSASGPVALVERPESA